jgi:hypothetical protein
MYSTILRTGVDYEPGWISGRSVDLETIEREGSAESEAHSSAAAKFELSRRK